MNPLSHMWPRTVAATVIVLLASIPPLAQASTTLLGPLDDTAAFYTPVTNGGFETTAGNSLTGWTLSGAAWTTFGANSTTFWVGARAAGIVDVTYSDPAAAIFLSRNINLLSGASYVLSAFVRNSSSADVRIEFNGTLVLQLDDGLSGTCMAQSVGGHNDWEFLLCPFQVPIGVSLLTLRLAIEGSVAAGDVIAFDDVAITVAAVFVPPISALTDEDNDGYTIGDGDCVDTDPSIHPDALEPIDGIDNDCNGIADDGSYDEDGDGSCPHPSVCDDGTVPGDCDDSDPNQSPTHIEDCDGLDQNCDGDFADEIDDDGDGLSECQGDCDDSDPIVSAGNPETCNGEDDDCDGIVDEGLDAAYRYPDNDGDGWGSDANLVLTCDYNGDGFSREAGDCDDDDASVYPGAPEDCRDDIDQDCDGTLDGAVCVGCTCQHGEIPPFRLFLSLMPFLALLLTRRQQKA